MDHTRSSLRVGAAAILCALTVRLFSSGLPEKFLSWVAQPNIAAFLIYLETGRDVRFSASSEVFLLFPAESPPPQIPEETTAPTEPPLPVFSDTALTQMYYANTKRPDLESLLSAPLNWDLTGDSPKVLILHTHSTESYTKSGERYQETSAWRTLDEDYNMLSIGSRVAEILAQKGITAIQDRTFHDYPSYNGSYVHARESLQHYLQEYPDILLVLDLHRDASAAEDRQLRTAATVDGQTAAQLMLVIGTNHGNWEENLSLGLKLQAQLETQAPGITRPTVLRSSRFNQDLSPGALLIEVGAAGNTHREALLAAEQLAEAIAALAKGTQ